MSDLEYDRKTVVMSLEIDETGQITRAVVMSLEIAEKRIAELRKKYPNREFVIDPAPDVEPIFEPTE